MHRALLVITILLGLAACSPQDAADGSPVAEAAPDVSSQPGATPPSAEASEPLDIGVVDAAVLASAPLAGELGCSFAPSQGGEALFVGRGDVVETAYAEGLVRIDGQPVKLTMDRTGGYNAMSEGTRFANGDTSVNIVAAGDEPMEETPTVAMESPIYSASMTIARGDRTVRIDGFYECGP